VEVCAEEEPKPRKEEAVEAVVEGVEEEAAEVKPAKVVEGVLLVVLVRDGVEAAEEEEERGVEVVEGAEKLRVKLEDDDEAKVVGLETPEVPANMFVEGAVPHKSVDADEVDAEVDEEEEEEEEEEEVVLPRPIWAVVAPKFKKGVEEVVEEEEEEADESPGKSEGEGVAEVIPGKVNVEVEGAEVVEVAGVEEVAAVEAGVGIGRNEEVVLPRLGWAVVAPKFMKGVAVVLAVAGIVDVAGANRVVEEPGV
jgi:hypothetical protein